MAVIHYTATVRPDRTLELPPEARQLLVPGEKVEIELQAILPPENLNASALETLRILAEMKKNMRETDGSLTDAMIGEARSGAMYGVESSE